MDKATMTQNVRRGKLQLEVLEHYLARGSAPPYTLYGRTKERCQLVEDLLVDDTFPLASRIMAEFNLPSVRIYSYAAGRLAVSSGVKAADKLLRDVKGLLSDRDWNDIILGVIQALIQAGKQKPAEKLVSKLEGLSATISGLIACSKYKAAYLAAVKQQNTDEVRRLRRYAIEAEPKIAALCDKYLSQHL